jgi:hypothetical protein
MRYKMHRWLTIVLAWLVCLAATPPIDGWRCRAGIIRDDDVDNNPSNNDTDGNPDNGLDDALYRSLANHSRFDTAMRLGTPGGGTCSCSLVAPNWVLTAGHCVLSRQSASEPNPGQLEDDRMGTFTITDRFGIQLTSTETAVNPTWRDNIDPTVPVDTNALGTALNAGDDFALIRLAGPSDIAPAMRNSTPITPAMQGGTVATLVGYGRHGTGLTGDIAGTSGTRRAGENVFDAFDGPGNNQMLFDLDNLGTLGTLGSDTPRTFEYIGAPGDSGGPWYSAINGQTKVVAVMSFGRNQRAADPNFHYGDVSGAGRVDLVNEWINETMGGVNWNTRVQSFFDDPDAWGDGSVPFGQDIQFSLPTASDMPEIELHSDVSVHNIRVKFGRHEFYMPTHSLTATGFVLIDHDGEMAIMNGKLVADERLTIGATGNGSLHIDLGSHVIARNPNGNSLYIGQGGNGVLTQSGGDLDVDTNASVAVSAGSWGTYHFSGGGTAFGASLHLGDGGTGLMNHRDDYEATDATLNVAIDFFLGTESTGSGRYDRTDGDLNVGRHLFVGYRGDGTFTQWDGDTIVDDEISVGRFSGSDGTLWMRGGELKTGADFVAGYEGKGVVNITGGTVVVGDGLGNDDLFIAIDNNSTNAVNQSGNSTVRVAGDVRIAESNSSAGSYRLSGGTLDVHDGEIRFGAGAGNFQFTGGTLHVRTFDGDLVNGDPINGGGKLAPGAAGSAGITEITGSYTVGAADAALEIEIGIGPPVTVFDNVDVSGAATLGGNLLVSMLSSIGPSPIDVLSVLDAASITGQFVNAAPGAMANTVDGLRSFRVFYGAGSPYDPTQVVLTSFAPPLLAGDYNNDNRVDTADYVVWRKSFGTTALLPNDAVGGAIGAAHLAQWKSHFGNIRSSGFAAGSAVPEPCNLVLVTICGCLGFVRRRHR